MGIGRFLGFFLVERAVCEWLLIFTAPFFSSEHSNPLAIFSACVFTVRLLSPRGFASFQLASFLWRATRFLTGEGYMPQHAQAYAALIAMHPLVHAAI